MDHRKALTISLAVDKDDSRIGNPLKIAKTLLSPKSGKACGKVQTQIHWTQITGPKVRYHDVTRKNGCSLLSPNHASSSQLNLGSKKPCLILEDVMKTDLGKAFMDRKRGGLLLSPPPNECWKRECRRESVLRLSGETRYGGEPSPKRRCLEGRGVDVAAGSSALQFPKSGRDHGEKAPGFSLFKGKRGASRRSQSSSMGEAAPGSSSEFIVLSSDEEEESSTPGAFQAHTTALQPREGEAELQRSSPRKEDSLEGDVCSQAHGAAAADGETLPVLGGEDDTDAVMTLPFSALRCGFHRARAGGPIRIYGGKIGIPLKDPGGQRRARLTLPTLQKYSFWDQEEHVARGLAWEEDGRPLPAAFLLLYVSESQTRAVHRELDQLLGDQERTADTGGLSPFLLLSLSDRIEGIEGALFRSNLDFISLSNLCLHDLQAATRGGNAERRVDLHSPLLPLDDCLDLVRRSGLDPQLLSALGLDTIDAGGDADGARAGPDPEPEPDPTQQDAEPRDEAERRAGLPAEPPPRAEEAVGEAKGEPTKDKSPEEVRPVYTLCVRRTQGSNTVSLARPDSTWTKYKHQRPLCRLIQFPPSPLKGGIPVTMEDLECLDSGHFLNDVIIDFYLKYLLLKRASSGMAERSHVFSSFFYKQLTRRGNAGEENTSASTQRQRRHQRVKNWTRHVDIFDKDFLFVPVNQESHWYLVVICFPGLAHARSEPWGCSPSEAAERGTCLAQAEDEAQGSHTADGESQRRSSQSEAQDCLTGAEIVQAESPPGPPDCTEQTCQRASVCKRPCILIMDSLKLSLHERVFKLLREYLQSEWEVRRGSERDFSGEQMKSSHCQVPLQDNSSDCGLYLLQYVESFLKDPVVHFDLPLRLKRWFPRQLVRRKRDEIRDLVLYLHRVQTLQM